MKDFARENYKTVAEMLSKQRRSLESVLPANISPKKVMRLALNEIMGTPKLLECTPRSLVAAVIDAAELGLVVKKSLGQTSLVPYENRKTGITTCQLILGYRGMIKLSYQNPLLKSMNAYAVYLGDEFSYSLGLHPDIIHVPARQSSGTRPVTHAYAIAELKTGGSVFVVLDKHQIDAARNRSRAKDNGPWVTDYAAMAIKTAIRRLWKMVPGCDEIVDIDDLEDPERQEIDITPQDDSWVSGLKDRPAAIEQIPAEETNAAQFDADGVLFDTRFHATGKDGLPSINADGTFRKRRGAGRPGKQSAAENLAEPHERPKVEIKTDNPVVQKEATNEPEKKHTAGNVIERNELDWFMTAIRQAESVSDVNLTVGVFENQTCQIPPEFVNDFRIAVSSRKAELLSKPPVRKAMEDAENHKDDIPL